MQPKFVHKDGLPHNLSSLGSSFGLFVNPTALVSVPLAANCQHPFRFLPVHCLAAHHFSFLLPWLGFMYLIKGIAEILQLIISPSILPCPLFPLPSVCLCVYYWVLHQGLAHTRQMLYHSVIYTDLLQF